VVLSAELTARSLATTFRLLRAQDVEGDGAGGNRSNGHEKKIRYVRREEET